MSFLLDIEPDNWLLWDDGEVSGTAEVLVDAEIALRQEWVYATPTGPRYAQGTPEAALLALRALWPQAEVLGEPPVIPEQEDELRGGEPLQEAGYREVLHPRGRRGQWIDKPGSGRKGQVWKATRTTLRFSQLFEQANLNAPFIPADEWDEQLVDDEDFEPDAEWHPDDLHLPESERRVVTTPVPPRTYGELAPTGKLAKRIEQIKANIDSVHQVAEIKPVPIVALHDEAFEASFVHEDGEPLYIRISPDSDEPGIAVTHEIGHLLDQQIGGGTWESEKIGGQFDEVIAAAEATWAVKRLNQLRDTDEWFETSVGQINPSDMKGYADYLLRRHEVFARAYAQWIGQESNDKGMIGGFEHFSRANSQLFPTHWEPDDFAPVAAAFDSAFRELGWIGGDFPRQSDPLVHQAFHDKAGGRVYWGTDGNYHLRKANGKPGGPIPEWNEWAKAEFGKDQIAFGQAAREYIRPVTVPGGPVETPSAVMDATVITPMPDVFESPEAAQAWFEHRWPDKQFDFEWLDMEVTTPALKQFVKHVEQYPWVEWAGIMSDKFKSVGPNGEVRSLMKEEPPELGTRAHAGIRKSDEMLLLNPLSFGDKDEIEKALEVAEYAEWHPPGVSPAALLSHEFMHLLDHALLRRDDMAYREPYGRDYGRIKETWKLWKKEAGLGGYSGYGKASVQRSRGDFDIKFEGERDEPIAELFMELHHTPEALKQTSALRLERLLAEIADESKWVPATNDRSISFEGDRLGGQGPLTDEDKAAWQTERREFLGSVMGTLWAAGVFPKKPPFSDEDEAWRQELAAFKERIGWDAEHERESKVWDARREHARSLRVTT